jgi:hypothetical protein
MPKARAMHRMRGQPRDRLGSMQFYKLRAFTGAQGMIHTGESCRCQRLTADKDPLGGSDQVSSGGADLVQSPPFAPGVAGFHSLGLSLSGRVVTQPRNPATPRQRQFTLSARCAAGPLSDCWCISHASRRRGASAIAYRRGTHNVHSRSRLRRLLRRDIYTTRC